MTTDIAKFEQFFSLVTGRLEQAQTTDEVIQIRNQASVLAAAARAAKDREYEEKATVVKQQSERRLGQLMAAQRDAGMMKEGRPKRGNENPVLESVGIDKNLAKAARKAYPEGWPKGGRPKGAGRAPAKQPLTPDELAARGFSPKTERYYTDDGGTASRIKLQKDERDSLKAENAGLKAEVVRLKADHKAEVARLTADLEAEQTGSLMKMSATAMAKRKELAAKLEDQKEIRKGTETVPDEKTKEAYERTIERLKAKIRVLESKLAAFMANGATVLDKADRKAVLVCLHPDGTSDPNERARREIAFKLFSAAVPEPEF
jgi:hypothetical protein